MIRQLGARLRGDHLLANSAYILLSTAAQGIFGFMFWLLVARLFPASAIGVATTLITGSILISYAALLGFNSTFVRYLPTSDDIHAEIDSGLALVAMASLVLATLYVVIVPRFAPALRATTSSTVEAVGFVVFTGFMAVNLVTDSVFIAFRSAKYNLLIDGILQCLTKLALPLVLVGGGAFAVFAAAGWAAVLAVIASIYFMVRLFDYRPRVRVSIPVVRRVLRFSLANYVANGLTIIPLFLLPLIVIRARGSASVGYYYIAYQIANLLFTVTQAVAQSMLAEGSHHGTSYKALVRRSGVIQLVTIIPATVVLALLSRPFLIIFGGEYARHASATLAVFALSAPAVALKNWTSTMMRINHQLSSLIWSNVIFAVALSALAYWWVGRGLGWVAFAWLIGNAVAGIYGVAAVLQRRIPDVAPEVTDLPADGVTGS